MKKTTAIIAALAIASVVVIGCQKQEAPKPAEQSAMTSTVTSTATTTAPAAAPAAAPVKK